MITIVNYGMGNLGSIANMLKRIGYDSIVTNNTDVIAQASKIILPGVGGFDGGMTNINQLNIISTLNQKVLEEKVPTLGICLGMQLMSEGSDEGEMPGLGWVKGRFKRFTFDTEIAKTYKVPHMGWNSVKRTKQSKVLNSELDKYRFYFVHSYYFEPQNHADVLGITNYQLDFASAFEVENITGVQFHPEKSHKYGMNLLANFASL